MKQKKAAQARPKQKENIRFKNEPQSGHHKFWALQIDLYFRIVDQ